MRKSLSRAVLFPLLAGLPLVLSAGPTLQSRLDEAKSVFDQRAYPDALAKLATLIRDAERAGDRAILARALYYKGRSLYFQADYKTALPLMQRALDLSRETSDRPFEGEVLRGIGRLHKQQGTYAEGLVSCQQSIAVFDGLGEKREAGRTWMTIGAIRDLTGEFELALEAYERARVALEGIQDAEYYTLFNEVGITYTNLGRYEEALAAHKTSLAAREKSGDKYLIGISHSNIGDVYFAYGQYERAIEHYLICLQICGFAGEKRNLAVTLQQLARTAMAMGNPSKAREYAERELAVTREIGNEPLEAVALRHMGEALLMQGDTAAGRSYHEQALALARKTGTRADEASSLMALASLDLAAGDARAAQPRGESALRIALDTQAPDLEIEARVIVARVARAQGARAFALTQLRKSVEIIDDVRGGVRTDSGKIGYLDMRRSVFELLALTLTEGGETAAALEVAEAARGRAFSDLLAAQRVTLKTADAGTFDDIRAMESRLRAAAAEPADESQRARLLVTRAAGKSKLDDRMRVLRNEQPELASLISAAPPGTGDIRAVAARLRATLVEYLVTDAQILAWVIAPDGKIDGLTLDVPRAGVRASVRGLHERMNGLKAADLGKDPQVNALLAKLHEWLLAPVEPHLPRDPAALVYVIPHDALHLVPFAALLDARGDHVVERHTLAYVPAAAVLKYTEPKKLRVVSPGRPFFLALADPTLPRDATGDALPGARDEVRQVANRFATDRRLILLGGEATESSLKRLGAAQTVLHLAAHGQVRDDRPWESALMLAPGEGEDGWLKVPEIFGLDLHADLVVLSGCSTGLGKLSGDGIVGLSRAVIYAGAPSVLVSQWDVSDRSTVYLMDRFYAARAAGRSKAHALRDAQLATLARHPHPALWAPFVLVGEP
jgi:CHAT domain-containing protein/tetratricopeptide (TPR) repeat protein